MTREAHICRAILKSFAKVFERIRKKRLGVFEATRPVSPRSNSAGKRTESSTFEVDPCVWIVIEQPGIGWEWGRVGALGWGCRGVRRGQCSRRFSKEMPPKHWQPPTGRQPTEAAAAQQPSADPQYIKNYLLDSRGGGSTRAQGWGSWGGEFKGVGGLLLLVGGWRWPHSDPNSPTPPPGPGNTEAPHQGHLPALNQRTYDQEERARSIEGLPWRALGRGQRLVVAGGGCFLRSHTGVPRYHTSGTHAQARTALRLCDWSSLFESPLRAKLTGKRYRTPRIWLGLCDCADGAECVEALGTQATASVTNGHPGSTLCLGLSIVTNTEHRDFLVSSLVGMSA